MKKILYLLFIIFSFIICIGNVNAKIITSEEVPVDTYIIGKHMFRHRNYTESQNYKGQLTTKLIMLSSTTIFSDDIEDMIIYYKSPLGDWWDGETGEDLTVPEEFDVEYIDLMEYSPTLMVCKQDEYRMECLGYETFIYNIEDYTEVKDGKTIYYLEGYLFGVDDEKYHYEIAEKIGNTYNPLTLDEDGYAKIELSSGERRTFVTRYYTLDANNNPVYSEYSNEAEFVGLDVTTYTVTFDYADGETLSQTQTVAEGSKVIEPLNPVRENHTFIEWRLNNVKYDFDTPVTENITLVAEWEENPPVQYTVTFDSNGGTAVQNQTVNAGGHVVEPQAPTKTNHTFIEWRLNSVKYDFDTPVTENITLVAEWEENPPVQYTVTFDSNGGTAVQNQTVNAGGHVVEPQAPTKNYYNFDGWKLNNSNYNFSSAVNSNITLVAAWTQKTFTIRKTKVDNLSLDVRLSVHDENGDEVEFNRIMYNNTIVPTVINASSIQDITIFQVVFADETVVDATVEN